jgi:hypothetical protein
LDLGLWPGSGRAGEFGERRGNPQSWDVESEFVVAAAKVLYERVSGDDRLRRSVGAQPAHRSHPMFEPPVIGLSRVVCVLLNVMPGRRDEFVEHSGVDRCR